MEKLDKEKSALLIIYKHQAQGYSFYFQKRGMNTPNAPGMFGFFGGGVDNNETPEQALIREIKEELIITPKNFWHLKDYEIGNKMLYVFCQKVEENFEDKASVLEGDYGKWFSKEEILTNENFEKEFVEGDKKMLIDFFQKMGL